MSGRSRIALVGMGCVLPTGAGPEALWLQVLAAADTTRTVPPGRWALPPEAVVDSSGPAPDRVFHSRGCFVDLVPRQSDGLDPVVQLALQAGRQAWASAATSGIDRRRVGVILGNIALPTEAAGALAEAWLGRTFREKVLGESGPAPFAEPPLHATSLPAALLAQDLGLGGGSCTLDAACASSLYAVKLAADELRAGRVDAMLAGGLSRPDSLYTQMGFTQLRALSRLGTCRPFDAAADGLIVGEGAGVFVLKRLEDAERDGDTILAILAGAGLSNDIDGGLLAPASEGQLRAMQEGYRQAGWSPADVDLIECHATGTPLGDQVEFQSMRTLWGDHGWRAGQCVIGAVKSTVGHLLTAAGAAGLVKVLAAVRAGTLPPTANFRTPHPELDYERSPFRVLTEGRPWQRRGEGIPRRAAISGFGFGGINAHLLLEEYLPPPLGRSGLPSRTGLATTPSQGPESGAARLAAPTSEGRRDKTSPAVAVVGMEARFGPWRSLREFQQRVFGAAGEPQAPHHWWAAEQSDWFRREGFNAASFAGFYLDGPLTEAVDRFRIPPRELQAMLPQQLLLLQTAAAALGRSQNSAERNLRAGVFVGLEIDLNTTQFHLRWSALADERLRSLADAVSPSLTADRTLGALGSVAASRVAREFRLGGPSFTLAAAECSGLRALETAVRALEHGEIDQALVGAVDLAGDLRAVLARHRRCFAPENITPGEGAAAVVLKRLQDALAHGDTILVVIRGIGNAESPEDARLQAIAEAGIDAATAAIIESVVPDIGCSGAALGLAQFVKAGVCLDQQILARSPPVPWLRDRAAGPRRLIVGSSSPSGSVQVVLEEWEPVASEQRPDHCQPLGPSPEGLFVIEGDTAADLADRLRELRRFLEAGRHIGIEAAARAWWMTGQHPDRPRAVSFVAESQDEALRQIAFLEQHLAHCPEEPLLPGQTSLSAFRDRLFFNPAPLGRQGSVAFVYPGSGNTFAGMGREAALRWPEVLRGQDAENQYLRSQYLPNLTWGNAQGTLGDRLLAQVAIGTFHTDLVRQFGIQPAAAIGYSLGESTALFALRAWTDRDSMLQRLTASPLFSRDLTGPCVAARSAWGLPEGTATEWTAGIVDRGPDVLRAACAEVPRAHLLIINTPRECVLGGQSEAVAAVVRRLGGRFVAVADSTTMHCSVAQPVAAAYRELHHLPVTPPAGVRFYSGAWGKAYELDSDRAADAILAQALDTIDFPAVIEAAYRDGVRLFVEIGPGVSCSRMIGAIFGDRPHVARSICAPHSSGVSLVLRLLAQLAAERVPLDLSPLYTAAPACEPPSSASMPGRTIAIPIGGSAFVVPRKTDISPPSHEQADDFLVAQIAQTAATQAAVAEAHAAYLRHAQTLTEDFSRTVAFQNQLFEMLGTATPSVFLDRVRCLEFAVGSIKAVLGPAFAAIDQHPTRVRLPDEPFMLVDRILNVEGEPLSLTSGRVVTEHDILPGAWYLDGGRIPTCIAVEAGQADLFLSGYLGIDLHTRGLAVYRLLDAVVTFHRDLPGPGETIRYDIHIDRFFRQGDTHFFRFHFEGTINGEPLLSMKEGCAGFFSAEELAAGRGVVRTTLDRQFRPGTRAPGEEALAPMTAGPLGEEQIDALRRGDLGSAFGPAFAGLTLTPSLRLPGGRMQLVHRVTELDPAGGRFGIGLIHGEADVHPDDWFLTCHFVDDQVMPGTLMYECALHTLRIFLLRMGWVAAEGEVVCQPVPAVASRLRCRGQVTPATRTVAYEVILQERGYRPEPYAIADALLYADGKPIVEITGLSLRLSGLDRERVTDLWQRRRIPPVAYPHERILAFAVGKPSEAFGEPYRVFDSERVIARLPGPPFQFLDRIVRVEGQPWQMVSGAVAWAEYDVPPDAWYFTAERQPVMPFAVLLETALQPCGWLAAYVGSALTSPVDLSFRNLGGDATFHELVHPECGILATRARLTEVSASAGMILHRYAFEVRSGEKCVYEGTTSFGFFAKEALRQQVGIRDARPYESTAEERPRGRGFPYPSEAPFPEPPLKMLDRIDLLIPDGGPAGLGFVQGSKDVSPGEWFFAAHFYQDPVWPGSLGLEAFLQLMKVAAVERWGPATRLVVAPGSRHRWLYRGQVVPGDRRVVVQAVITAAGQRELTADGWLLLEGRVIYRMQDFTLRVDSA
jgi:acyl transferase domain-containing protein/3-hydroxymyristoyl/3-hydroxydecanoyl-(acyl carrier protein) dehydratase